MNWLADVKLDVIYRTSQTLPHNFSDVVGLLLSWSEKTQMLELGKSSLKHRPRVVSLLSFCQRYGAYMVLDSSSPSSAPTIALNADQRSVALIRAPDSRYI